MRRTSRFPLRGSVTQSASVRLRARDASRAGILVRLSVLAGSLALIAGLGFWLWHIGWPQREAAHAAEAGLHLTQKAGFEVSDIVVEGRRQASKDNLAAALGVARGAPILAFDPAAAEARIAKLPWISSVVVERRLPDTILVQIAEYVPMARWQHEGRTVVISTDGKELPEAKPDQFGQLPLMVGAGAPEETATLLGALKDYPAVTEKMTAAVRVGGRRWDLHLQPNVTAELPEGNLDDALKRLAPLITNEKILERDVAVIDLRLPDRVAVEPAGPVPSRPVGDKL